MTAPTTGATATAAAGTDTAKQASQRRFLTSTARGKGRAGESAPNWVSTNPDFQAAYDEGAGSVVATSGSATKSGKASTPKNGPAGPSGKSGGAGTGSMTGSKTSPPRKSGSSASFAPNGDAGGLLLALLIYPLGMSYLRYGTTGPWIWFKAKFLNMTTGAPTDPTYGKTLPPPRDPTLPPYDPRFPNVPHQDPSGKGQTPA